MTVEEELLVMRIEFSEVVTFGICGLRAVKGELLCSGFGCRELKN